MDVVVAGAPGHPALAAASRHKKLFEQWFVELLEAEDIGRPDFIARQLMILFDGAITQILIHHDCTYAEVAGAAAIVLIEGGRKKL